VGKPTQHDVVARRLAVIGSITGVLGLLLSYLNYHRQNVMHEQSLEERVYVHLSASRTYDTSTTIGPEGKLGVEVVNIGEKPVYLKSVTGQFPGVLATLVLREGTTLATFHEYDPLDPNSSVRKLEPGEEVSYTTDWMFAQHPTQLDDVPKFSGTVEVETTTKRFTLQTSVSRYAVSYVLPMNGDRRQLSTLESLGKPR
jgi:hypothetical protein